MKAGYYLIISRVTFSFKWEFLSMIQYGPAITRSNSHRPLARYVILRFAHVPGMPVTFSLPLRFSDPDTHHGTCVTHVTWCMSGSLTRCFLWSRWRGKRSRHTQRMRNPQLYISLQAHDISFCNQLRKWIYYNEGKMDDFKTNITKLYMNTILGILALR